jgi:GntR family transcriptional regulator
VAVGVVCEPPQEQQHNPDDRCEGRGQDGATPTAPSCTLARLFEERLGVTVETLQRSAIELIGDAIDEAIIASTMRRVNVRRDSSAADLHEQVAAQIRRAIAEGEARPGERLPPARDLAAELGVNRNTVLRALRALRDEGLLDFKRGRGVTVVGEPADGALVTRAREFVAFGRRLGYGVDEILATVERVSE